MDLKQPSNPAIELTKDGSPFKFTQWTARCCAKFCALLIGRIANVGRCGKRQPCGQNGAETGGTGWAMTAMLTAFGSLDEPLPIGPQHPVTIMRRRFDAMSSARRRGE